MELLQVLSLLAFVVAKGRGFISKLPGFKTCTWKYCRGTEWRNDWAPSITTGKCVKQHRDAHFLYETRKENFICPPPIPCLSPTKQYRTMCELTSFIILFYQCIIARPATFCDFAPVNLNMLREVFLVNAILVFKSTCSPTVNP